jgi:hypothetical protein
MTSSSTPVTNIAPISPTSSLGSWVHSKDRLHLDARGGLQRGTGEDKLHLLNRGLRVLRHEGGSDGVEVRVEQDVLVLLVIDGLAHGLEAYPGSLCGDLFDICGHVEGRGR